MTELSHQDALLDRFRQWLQESTHDPEQSDPLEVDDTASEVGLYRLIEEFTALRHELKLQTKSGRGLQEQTEALLTGLRQAIDAIRSAEPKSPAAAQSPAKPLAEALADLDDAIDRGRVEVDRGRSHLVDEPNQALRASVERLYRQRSWLQRRLNRGFYHDVLSILEQGEARPRAFYAALVEGYGLIQGRFRRALQGAGIERITTLGQPVAPETMTVVEVVDSASHAPGTVIDEVRRGYLWQGRVLRFAEVRAARARPAYADASDADTDADLHMDSGDAEPSGGPPEPFAASD